MSMVKLAYVEKESIIKSEVFYLKIAYKLMKNLLSELSSVLHPLANNLECLNKGGYHWAGRC